MRIQTECMCSKNCWTISCSYDFQAHQQRSQRRCCFSQTALLWFEVLPDMSLGLPGLLPGLPGLSQGLPGLSPGLSGLSPGLLGLSHGHSDLSPGLSDLSPGLLGMLPGLSGMSPVLRVTLKACRIALRGFDTLLKLMHPRLQSTSSQILLEASSDWNTLCWWTAFRRTWETSHKPAGEKISAGSGTAENRSRRDCGLAPSAIDVLRRTWSSWWERRFVGLGQCQRQTPN